MAFLAILKRQFWAVLASLVISLAVAGAYLVLANPKYTGTATLLTETSRTPSQVTSPDQQGMVDSAVVQSQIAMLNSEGLARQVIAKFKLESDPEFSSPGLVSRLMSLLGLSRQATPGAEADTVLSRFTHALTVTRIEQSYVVEVAFTCRDPQKAADIANAIAQTYLDDQLAARMSSGQRANQWMGRWVQMARAEMNAADQKLASVRQAQTTGSAANDGSAAGTLDTLQKAAESKRAAYQAVRTRAERLLQFVENQSVPYTQARIVSDARASTTPSSPRVALTVLLACFCGGILGVAVGNVREAFDRKIHTPDQMAAVAEANLVLAVPWPRRSRPARGVDPRVLARYRKEDNSAIWRLRAAVEQFARVSGTQLLAIVSPHEEDGRSVIAAALAEAIARSGDRAVLVRTDRAADSARERAPRERVKRMAAGDYSYDILDVLPSQAGGGRPAQLRRLETELKGVVEQYRYVLIDCPAVLDHPEISAALEAVDACIMVAHVARSSLSEVRDAREMMPFDRDQVIAALVTRPG